MESHEYANMTDTRALEREECQRARELGKQMTPTEKIFLERLRNRQLEGLKFRFWQPVRQARKPLSQSRERGRGEGSPGQHKHDEEILQRGWRFTMAQWQPA